MIDNGNNNDQAPLTPSSDTDTTNPDSSRHAHELAKIINTTCLAIVTRPAPPIPIATRPAPPIPTLLNQPPSVNRHTTKTAASYRLSLEAPIVEIVPNDIEETVERFLESLDVVDIEAHGDNMAEKAQGCRAIAEDCIDDTSDQARIFSYQLDNNSVGLISVKISPDDIYVVGVMAHPGVHDAGFLLIEHVLQYSLRQPPLVRLRPAGPAIAEIYKRMGFKYRTELTDTLWLDLADVDTEKFWHKIADRYVCIQANGKIFSKHPRYLSNT